MEAYLYSLYVFVDNFTLYLNRLRMLHNFFISCDCIWICHEGQHYYIMGLFIWLALGHAHNLHLNIFLENRNKEINP